MRFSSSSIVLSCRARYLFAALALCCASPAQAVDGVLEINQSCAVTGGCFAGDTAGFPVTISDSGSYRLTGDLTVQDGNTTAIQIATAHVTIDLNGFSITGPAVCSGQPVTSCTNEGIGDGIMAANDPNYHHIRIRNGDIRGMGDDGVSLTSIEAVHLDNVRTVGNAGGGFTLGTESTVTNCAAEANQGLGISAGAGSRIQNSTAAHNGGTGISLNGGTAIVKDSTVINNGNIGLSCGSAETDTCIVETVISSQNATVGMSLGTNHALVRGSNITSNGTAQLSFSGTGGYVGNVISGTNVISGAGAVELGLNLCNGNTSCL